MSIDLIKEILETGECPVCHATIIFDDELNTYFCEKDKSHITLEVKFKGGESIEAILNGEKIPGDQLKDIEW